MNRTAPAEDGRTVRITVNRRHVATVDPVGRVARNE